jgi:hypothetical protein
MYESAVIWIALIFTLSASVYTTAAAVTNESQLSVKEQQIITVPSSCQTDSDCNVGDITDTTMKCDSANGKCRKMKMGDECTANEQCSGGDPRLWCSSLDKTCSCGHDYFQEGMQKNLMHTSLCNTPKIIFQFSGQLLIININFYSKCRGLKTSL